MYRVLLADDEQIERMALARKLQRAFGGQLEICDASDGKMAIEVFQKQKSQIVIMDISMPEMNGMEAAEEIRKMDANCVILFLTAYDEFSYAKRAFVIRALDYLLKPCDKEELSAVMEEAMRITDQRLAGESEQTQAEEQPESEPVYRDGGAGDTRLDCVAETLRQYIRENYMNEISMQDAARRMQYSDAYFSKLFKQCFDQNFTTYLMHFRVEEAKKLLQNRQISVKDVSAKVGYYDSNYFAKVFKRITGMIPSEYRAQFFAS